LVLHVQKQPPNASEATTRVTATAMRLFQAWMKSSRFDLRSLGDPAPGPGPGTLILLFDAGLRIEEAFGGERWLSRAECMSNEAST